ncbi:hypothetical protein EGJ28_16750 [Stutzerimonas xanthomarina]|jgi:hypothetical protein|uniref:Uncharacterized protein n=2 Tax=Stutzerimonas TaxID=2901164 RepID=A0AA40RTZ6_STUST|nr:MULTISPECIES: hypothetical protein [Stutzerimonas]KIL03228.1 hypothetical protein QX25_18845 [Stutzerimonas stutzeri]MBA1306005.1 hypothetical protein [Stutzerimonas stutzeri]MBK3920053.1 hypothetical protein [Stutzerimonas frequens]RRV08912.1 hypothetical protein EGJ28_16750 [Stutzerimonas xanthomarina]
MKLLIALIVLASVSLAALAIGTEGFNIESERMLAAFDHMSWRPWVMVASIGLLGSAFALLCSGSKPRTAFVGLLASWLPTALSLAGLLTLTLVDTTSSQTAGGVAAGIIILLCLSLAALLSSLLFRAAAGLRRWFARSTPGAL